MPTCARCTRLGHQCSYPVRNPAVAYIKYVHELEADIAKLEQELSQMEPGIQEGVMPDHSHRGGWRDWQMAATLTTASPTPSESLIQNLFAHSASDAESQVKVIMDDLIQVSLSALASSSTTTNEDKTLRTLILSAALPTNTSKAGRDTSRAMALPGLPIAEKVLLRYCHDILPTLPFLTPADIEKHVRGTYCDRVPYSVFITAITLATTAISMSPASVTNAASLVLTGIHSLEAAFQAQLGNDSLQDLESVLALAQFAALAGDDHADGWALTGIAVRIAVDLGLHKVCDTDRKRRLFWSAYALDRQAAASRGFPVGLPEAAIEAPFPESPHPFPMYRT
jgi:hypothetical protein